MCKRKRSNLLNKEHDSRLFRHGLMKSLTFIVMTMSVCSIILIGKIVGMEEILLTVYKLMNFNMAFLGDPNGNFAIILLANFIPH